MGIAIEVAYGNGERQWLLRVVVPEESTIAIAIAESGILEVCPEIDLAKQKVGIFSKICALTDGVRAGDRIEIYRPLIIDPKEARRQRAKKM